MSVPDDSQLAIALKILPDKGRDNSRYGEIVTFNGDSFRILGTYNRGEQIVCAEINEIGLSISTFTSGPKLTIEAASLDSIRSKLLIKR